MAVKRDGGGKAQFTLRDHRKASDAASAELPALVAVFGECEFLRSEAAGEFRRAWLERYPGGDTVVFRPGDGRPLTLADLLRDLSGGSLFAKEKLVVVRQAEKLLFPQGGKNEAAEDDADAAGARGAREKAFIEYLEKPARGIWLVLESASLPRNRTLGKKAAELCHLVPCPPPAPRDVPPWLAERASALGKKLGDDASDLLMRAYGADLGILAAEVEKLALFAGEAERIDASMVGEFLTGTIEFDIFGLTNAVEARDVRQAVIYARRIAVQGTRDQRGKKEDGERSAHRVLSMLAGTVQGLLRAGVALAAGQGAAEFAAAEKLSPWRASRLFEAAGRFELRELRVMARMAAEQLRGVHDTGGDPLLALETMAVRFAGGRKRAKSVKRGA